MKLLLCEKISRYEPKCWTLSEKQIVIWAGVSFIRSFWNVQPIMVKKLKVNKWGNFVWGYGVDGSEMVSCLHRKWTKQDFSWLWERWWDCHQSYFNEFITVIIYDLKDVCMVLQLGSRACKHAVDTKHQTPVDTRQWQSFCESWMQLREDGG